MNIQEQISRTKDLMGIQPLNEGIFKLNGKLKDILGKLFKKNNTRKEILNYIDPYEVKYGHDRNCYVDTLNLLSTNQSDYSKITGSTEQFQQIFVEMSIITSESRPLLTDNTKKSYNVGYLVTYQNKQGNNIPEFYEYFKTLYYIDSQQTDELSMIKVGNDETCTTNTLAGKKGGCVLPQELKDKILNAFKDSKDFTKIQAYLGKVK
jgi:hypothetical protein